MKCPALLLLSVLPLGAQTWDLRLEIPFPKGQSLPGTLLQGTGQLVSGDLDTGKGGILTVSRRLLRVGPVLRFDWTFEASRFKADGRMRVDADARSSALTQSGAGLGLNAQFWVPFTGLAGELGVIGRFQHYAYEGAGARQTEALSRAWLRVGARWRLPLPGHLYVAASYQEPLRKDRPVRLGSVADLESYLTAQGSGQEFERLWTFGAGLQF